MSVMTTFAPASASAVAMPSPMPEAAPVMIAVLPEMSFICEVPSSSRMGHNGGSILVAYADLHVHPTAMVQPPRTSTPIEVLAGLVERVTFHNAENGFCVLRVKARGQRDLITVLGHAAIISAGEFVQASGIWVNDRTHGVQFKAAFLKAAQPTTIEGIEKYLGSGMIRGIGPVYAKKLVRAFGEAVFEIIEQEPDRLRQV